MEVEGLEAGIEGINELTKKVAEYFCEDEKKLKLQEILNLFKTFCDQLNKAKKVEYRPCSNQIRTRISKKKDQARLMY